MDAEKYIIDSIAPIKNKIPVVAAELSVKDKIDNLKVRFSMNRMHYKVKPGLYAIGKPDGNSNIFVSANYKLSFDILRKNLNGISSWILVLDTNGVNVWCAAGKGTFGTNELIERIKIVQLGKIVKHRILILPQLGAVGVAAHAVKKETGFRVIYGPIQAQDIQDFIANNKRATPKMREIQFSFYHRLKLVPAELAGGLKYLLIASALFFLVSGISGTGYSSTLAMQKGLRPVINLIIAYLSGTFLGPLLLPWIPGKSFAFKGFLLGFILAFIIILLDSYSIFEKMFWLLALPAISSFILMNFTGASTYTSLSGVLKEMKVALPLQIAAAALAIIVFIISIIYTLLN